MSPFTYYRGAALPMAADLAGTPTSGLRVQLCGDAHLANFGGFASPERRLIFDVNDFDETLPGPFEWDVKRFAASLAVAGRDNGFAAKQRRKVALAGVEAYRTAMREFANMPMLDVWYAHLNLDDALAELGSQVSKKRLKRTERTVAKARTRDSMQAFGKLTTDGRRPSADHQRPTPDRAGRGARAPTSRRQAFYAQLHELLDSYSAHPARRPPASAQQFTLIQLARKVVGVGSVGTRAWIMLLDGRRRRRTRCSSRPRRPRSRCWPSTPAPASTPTRANGWWRGSTSCRPQATSSWAGSGPRASTASSETSTSASCATGRAPRTSSR